MKALKKPDRDNSRSDRVPLRATVRWPPAWLRPTAPSPPVKSREDRGPICEAGPAANGSAAPHATFPQSVDGPTSTPLPAPSVVEDAGWGFHERNEFYWKNIYDEDLRHLLGPRVWPKPCPWCGGRAVHSQACRELRDGWAVKMPFGKYKGIALSDVPGDYLQWLISAGVTLDGGLREAVERELEAKLSEDRKRVDFGSAHD